jgi:hypothetical protein
MKRFEFDAIIQGQKENDAGYIEFPYDVKQVFEGKGRVKIKAYFDGIEYRGSLVKMGGPCHFVGIRKDIQKLLGKKPGDNVHMVIEEDLEERTVEVPQDLQELLKKDSVAQTFFQKLSFSHQKEYVQWIDSAKKPETRMTRIQKTVEMLQQKLSLK